MSNFNDYWERKRPLTVHELLAELENIEDDNHYKYDVYITPPTDAGNDTDEDSGEEDCQDPDRLNHNQLDAEAELYINDKPVTEENNVEDNTPTTSSIPSNPHKKVRKATSVIQERPKWVVDDLENPICENWSESFLPPISLGAENHSLDFFELFMPAQLVLFLVKHTVQYAGSKNRQLTVSVEDMYAFLGILYVSGYNVLPRRRMYWEENDDVQNRLISTSMRRKTFEDIFRNLHAADNSVLDPTDRMAKVRPLIVALNRLFMDYAPIEQSISIDESMIPYFGRHGCKQFIRGKPIRFGFKSWVMATRLGYCLQFNLYQGRRGNDKQDCGLGESVVYNFADVLQTHFENLKFSLFFDNFFTSVKLLTTLGERRIGGTGTVRVNRTGNCNLPNDQYKKTERGSYNHKIDEANNIFAVRWKDNSIVTLLSNQYGVKPLQSAARYSAKEKKKVYIPQPNVVSMYNKYMGGVDQFDNNIATYRISMRGKKWCMPIIMWMFDTAMNNAWRLARNVGKSLDNLAFRREVGQALLKKYGKLPLRHGPTSSYSYPLAARRNTKHIILTNQLRRRCAVCKSKTVKACSTCQVPLHDKCFSAFHPNN
ncbi:hypothetical protein ILUMI_03555 [Ignelater luminosus]|uniref:PiggyBac transposable element-derived protein domain-containing protein n=1 Tax=Ignelater luminosus TaxID=2038154 RepID=A0A8K0DAS7_IGNLU|nr:hypothetical protein ILUMI_03555 [Ignelater luminosus]